MKSERKRRYLLNTNVPLSAYYERLAMQQRIRLEPYALRWLGIHGTESYYTKLLLREIKRIQERLQGRLPSELHILVPRKEAALAILRGNGVARLSIDVGKVVKRAYRTYTWLVASGVNVELDDVMYLLVAKEHSLALVGFEKKLTRVAPLIGAVYILLPGMPRGPQDVLGGLSTRPHRPGGKTGEGGEKGPYKTGGAGKKSRGKREKRRS